MTNGIVLSQGVRENLLSLQNTTKLLAASQQRLSSGQRVNSALDDPVAFSTATSLNNRASDLSSLLDDIGQSVQTINAAESGLEGIGKLVEAAEGIVAQARETTVTASTASLSGTFTNSSATDSANVAFGLGLAANSTTDITLTDSEGTDSTVTVATGSAAGEDSIDDVATAINALAGYSATVSDGEFTISRDDGTSFTVAGFSGTSASLNGTHNNGTNRAQQVENFNEIREQIDQLAADSSYKGVNLLNGESLTVIFNESRTSSIDISSNKITSDDLSIAQATSASFGSDQSLEAVSRSLEGAQKKLQQTSSELSTDLGVVETRKDHTTSLINTLKAGASDLLAADTNEEAANVLALQTRQQLSSTALALSARLDQSALRLL